MGDAKRRKDGSGGSGTVALDAAARAEKLDALVEVFARAITDAAVNGLEKLRAKPSEDTVRIVMLAAVRAARHFAQTAGLDVDVSLAMVVDAVRSDGTPSRMQLSKAYSLLLAINKRGARLVKSASLGGSAENPRVVVEYHEDLDAILRALVAEGDGEAPALRAVEPPPRNSDECGSREFDDNGVPTGNRCTLDDVECRAGGAHMDLDSTPTRTWKRTP